MGMREVLEEELGTKAYLPNSGTISPVYVNYIEREVLRLRLRVEELELRQRNEGKTLWQRIRNKK